VTATVIGANELTDETRRLMEQRVSLLALRKRVVEESSTDLGRKPEA
jgi:hypothetical protein